MPSNAPPVSDHAAARLGGRIRAQRKSHRLSATTAAEAAGMSRVTWHRIERGLPSVAMGAYMNAALAVGLELDVASPQGPGAVADVPTTLPQRIRVDQYPQLAQLAWQLRPGIELTPAEALNLYERNWRHVEVAGLTAPEQALVEALVHQLGWGRLLV